MSELDTKALMQLALDETGAAGFDDECFVESMEQWLRGVAAEGRLSAAGVMGMKANVQRILVNRLRIEADLRSHPEILEEDVSAPIIVTGIPRTGTTKLQRLLSRDAVAASPRSTIGTRTFPAECAATRCSPTWRRIRRSTKFHLDEIVDVARTLIPDDLAREAAAIGSLDDCVRSLSAFKDAGADELFCYGSAPADNEKLVAAWRFAAARRR